MAPPLRVAFLRAAHSGTAPVHVGAKTCKRVLRHVGWNGLHVDIGAYIAACRLCQSSRCADGLARYPAGSSPVDALFARVHVDVWSITWPIDGKEVTKHCLTMVDSLSRWPEVALLSAQTGSALFNAFYSFWVSRFGWPALVVCDNAPAFVAGVFAYELTAYGVRLCPAAPYHPQGNGLVESFHRQLNHGVRQLRELDATMPFERALSATLFTLRASPHSAIRDSPAFFVYGQDPRHGLSEDFAPRRYRSTTTGLSGLAHFLDTTRTLVADRLAREAARRLEQVRHERAELELLPGQLVLLPRNRASTKHIPKSWTPFDTIAYRVVRVMRSTAEGPRVLLLRNPTTGRFFRVHESDIRRLAEPLDSKQATLSFACSQPIQPPGITIRPPKATTTLNQAVFPTGSHIDLPETYYQVPVSEATQVSRDTLPMQDYRRHSR